MRIEFQLTREDFAEATRRLFSINLWLILWLFVLLTLVLPLTTQILYPYVPPPAGVTVPPEPYSLVRDTLLPLAWWVLAALILTSCGTLFVRYLGKPWRRRTVVPGALVRVAVAVALSLTAAAVPLLAVKAVLVRKALAATPGVAVDPAFNPVAD